LVVRNYSYRLVGCSTFDSLGMYMCCENHGRPITLERKFWLGSLRSSARLWPRVPQQVNINCEGSYMYIFPIWRFTYLCWELRKLSS
jgi:hypothetical protein